MIVKDMSDDNHRKIIIKYSNKEDYESTIYCGQTYCTGICGLPALTIRYCDDCENSLELKAHGNQVAVGPVFDGFRVKWLGEKKYIDNNTENHNKLINLKWW